jgi:two-component system chemotaxis response regulator CheB
MIKEIKIVIIGGSAGSFNIIKKILSSLPDNFPLPVVLCLHRHKEFRTGFVESLSTGSKIIVREPLDKESIKSGHAYLSPANYHMLIEPSRCFALSIEPDINYSRPAIDITFESAGYSFRNKMTGILLSGANTDGAKGLLSAFNEGAHTVIQDPSNALFETMPVEVLKYFKPHKILTDEEIINFINSLKYNKYV